MGDECYMEPDFWASDTTQVMGGNDEVFPSSITEALPAGAVLFSSSGSSGVHKWIVHTRETLQLSARAVNEHLQVHSADTFGQLLPSLHVGGFGLIARAYFSKNTLVRYEGKWDAQRAVSFLAENRVTLTSLVPTQVYDLVNAGLRSPETLRAVVVGGGELTVELGQKARDLGWKVLASYGMTEAGSQIATATLESLQERYKKAPLPVLPCWTLSVEEDGGLVLSGAPLAKALVIKEDGEWRYREIPQGWKTNDHVTLGDDGEVTFLGRLDRVVKVKGELVDLDRLEKTLSEELGRDLYFLPLKDERSGVRLQGYSEAQIPKEAVTDLLPRFLELESITQVDEILKTPLGKIDRSALNS